MTVGEELGLRTIVVRCLWPGGGPPQNKQFRRFEYDIYEKELGLVFIPASVEQ